MLIHHISYLYKQTSDLVDHKGDQPCNGQLKQGNESCPFPAFGFFMNGRKRCGTGNVKQTEYHQTECVELTKSDRRKDSRKFLHSFGRACIDDAEQDGTAGNNNFFR